MEPKYSIGERVYTPNPNNSDLYETGVIVGIQESGFWLLKEYIYLIDCGVVRGYFRKVPEDKLWKKEVTNGIHNKRTQV